MTIVWTEQNGLIHRETPIHHSIREQGISVLRPASSRHLGQNLLIDPTGVLLGRWILISGGVRSHMIKRRKVHRLPPGDIGQQNARSNHSSNEEELVLPQQTISVLVRFM